MSTNKKFRVQNGLDVTGEVTVGGVTVINADGTVVSDVSDQLVPLQADVAALETSVENIIGTSPETLDTLQEIVAAYEGADSDLQLLVAQTNQSVQDLENSVGAGAALTVTSEPTTINYEESLGSVFKIFASDNHDQGILYSSNNYNSVTVFNRYNTANSALQAQGFDKSFVTSDAFFLHYQDRVIEYALDENAIENDQRAVEYVGWPADEYSRMIYADDDVVALVTDDNMSSARFRVWTRGDGSSGTTIAIPTAAQDWNQSWGRTITRAGDYFIIGGSRGGSVHNLDGSFVKYFYASTYFSYTQDVNFGGANKKSAVASYGSTLVIGCPNAVRQSGVVGSGAILIFDMNDLNIMPTVVYCPTPDYPNDHFGYSVDVTADRIYVAAPGINQTNDDHPKGRAFVLELDGTLVQEITDPNPNSHMRNFAYFLGVSGTTLAIGAEGYDNSIGSKGGIYLYDTEDLASGHVEELVYPGTYLDYPKRFFVTTAELLTQSASDVIVPSSGVVPAINYLEDKTNDMQAEINALSGTDTSLTTSVAANAAAITANTAAISAEATARQAAIDAIPAPDLSSYATSASVTAGDLALQDQIDAIVGTSPETLDTLQEIVAAFEDADSDLQTLMTTNASSVSTLQSFVGSVGPDKQYLVTTSNDTEKVYLYDVSDMSLTTIDSPFVYPQGGWGKLAIPYGNNLFVKGYSDVTTSAPQWVRLDLNDPTAPGVFLTTDMPSIVQDIVWDGQFAYASYWDGVTKDSSGNSIKQLAKYDGFTFERLSTHSAPSGANNVTWMSGQLAIDGTTLYVSDNGFLEEYANSSSGKVFVYDTSNLDTPTHVIYAPNPSTSSNIVDVERFGHAVEVGEKWIVISAMHSDTTSTYPTDEVGVVFVYDKNNLSATPIELFVAGELYFGSDVAVKGDLVFVGARDNDGTVYVFDMNSPSPSNPTYSLRVDDAYSPSSQSVGQHIAINDSKLFVNAKQAKNPSGVITGAIYVWDTSDFSADPTIVWGNEPNQLSQYSNGNWNLTAPAVSLQTTAANVVGAINELHTELQTLAGLDTSIVGDVATNTQAIADEVARATAAEAALAADIAAESSARSAKGNTQDTNIAANATAISNEVTRATAAEQANTDAIVVEAAARAAADSDLSASISAIASGVNTGDLTVTGSATFESGINVGSNGGSIGYDDTSEDIQMMSDVDMSGNLIHNLGTPVASTDAASKSYVDGRISSVIGGSVESLDTIKEVVDAFQNADSDIQSLITANSTSVSANTTAIAAETTRAQGVEASLQSQINAVSTSESDLSDALDAEIARATAAEAQNATDIDSLEATVGSVDVQLLPSSVSANTYETMYTTTVNTVIGQQYTISFDYSNPDKGFGFYVWSEAGNVNNADLVDENFSSAANSSGSGSRSYTITATSETTGLAFRPENNNSIPLQITNLSMPSPAPTLNTTAQVVIPAINELAAAVADTSGITAAFQAADSDVTAAFQAADASLQAQIDAGAFDGSAIDQNLVPATTDTYSLGTPDKVWKDLYIGPGSLYLNGTKILEDNSGTITMYADAGQNLSFGASGGGSIDLNAGSESIQIKSDLVLSVGETISTVGGAATRFGGSVNMQTHKIENVGAPTADLDVATKLYVDTLVAAGTVSGDRTFDANVVVEGNLTVSGTTTTVNSETISLADNIIDLNSNLTSGAPSEHAGIRVLRGDESAVQVRWNETSDHWEVYNGSAWTKIALNTDDLAEGSTNQYFTEVRARGCVSADENSCIDYNEATGKFSLDVAETEAAITPDSAKDADKLDGQHGSYYRINVYDANGALVN